jgi:hypothetical protein
LQQNSEFAKEINVLGASGDKGDCGSDGAPGAPGPMIVEWRIIADQYLAIPLLDDGRAGAPLRLRELFEQFNTERGAHD